MLGFVLKVLRHCTLQFFVTRQTYYDRALEEYYRIEYTNEWEAHKKLRDRIRRRLK